MDLILPRKRPHRLLWQEIRKKIFSRDGEKCTRCQILLSLGDCHIDHVISGKLGNNRKENLRTLCRRCHVLRLDHRHRGMLSKALRDGIIPPKWRDLVWE